MELEKLGEGGFGEVWKVRNRLDGQVFPTAPITDPDKTRPPVLALTHPARPPARTRQPVLADLG